MRKSLDVGIIWIWNDPLKAYVLKPYPELDTIARWWDLLRSEA
jgi:hypothetical protein